MFILRAPYPSVQATLTLPSPNWGDSVGNAAMVQILRAMDGTRYTYVHAKEGRKKLQWDFTLSRNKAMELRAFINVYFSHKIEVTDSYAVKWVGYFTNNPFEYTGSGKAGGFPGGETMDVTISFEESE